MRRPGLVLLIWAAAVRGFHFPDEEVMLEATTEPEYDYDAEPTVDPLEPVEELEGRFLLGKRHWKKLGAATASFLNTISSNGLPDENPAQQPSPQSGVSNEYSDYDESSAPESAPSHGFPVDANGNISCMQVRRRRKHRCRQAKRRERQRRRQEQREGRHGGGRRPGVAVQSPGVPLTGGAPDRRSLKRAAQKCCHLQQADDMIGFNNCCQQFGFCPMCKVDSARQAETQCCPLLHDGNQQGYRRCCSTYGHCPYCEKAAEPAKPAGCLYKGKLFKVGSEMDKLAYKCMFVRCRDNGNGPETDLEYLDQVGCCEQGKDLFPPGRSVQVDECTSLVCTDGKWVKDNANLAAVLASPCPDGWLDLGASCVFIWRELMTWTAATESCGRLQSRLALPQNQAQLAQLINAFNNMEDRDSTKELGGWVDARHSGSQWQTSAGDTLTFQPWEQGAPDDLRRTACAGLTVTQRSQGWKDYMCESRQHMLYPMCQVDKKGCGADNSGCGPVEGDQMFRPDSVISSEECEIVKCDTNSYTVRVVNPQCCYHHEWNGKAFGRARGWYAGLYTPGGFQPYSGLLCDCTDGVGDCTQFYDYEDYDENEEEEEETSV